MSFVEDAICKMSKFFLHNPISRPRVWICNEHISKEKTAKCLDCNEEINISKQFDDMRFKID